MAMVVNRFEVVLINLDPTIGSEIMKTRPCLIISPDEMNRYLNTVIVAPMTTAGKGYPTRVSCIFEGKKGKIVLDQIRPIDRRRIIRKLGDIHSGIAHEVSLTLQRMFAF